jgi:hypothetical protein
VKRWLPVLLLAACSAGTPPPAPPAPADTAAWYRQAAAAGTPVFAVAPAESLVAVTVRRGGLLARFGHDHLVASHAVTGFASPAAGRADLSFRADALTVDEPALRAAAGLGPQPPQDAVDATRANMLARVLDAGRFPVVALHAERIAGDPARLRVAITLHGVTRRIDVPADVREGPRELRASGAVQLRQSDFGITPLAVAGGLLAVQDAVGVRFLVVARRTGP